MNRHQRPNIVLIMTDQQRADFTAAAGFPLDTMPFIDSLAARGTRFTRAYTPMPTCAPARCSLFSGRWPHASRVRENWGINAIRRTTDLPETLRAQGYALWLAGKNHSYLRREELDACASYMHTGSLNVERSAQEEAFDRYLDGLDHGVATEPAPFPVDCQLPARIVRDAISMVDTHDAAQPFFLWLSFPEPHNPYQVPEPYFSLFDEQTMPEPATTAADGAAKGPKWRWMQTLIEEKRPGYREQWRRYRANYCGMLRLIDDQLRRFAQHLESQGLLDNTLFVFVSDHGDYAGDYGLQRKGVGLPETLVRVPMVWAGPGVEAGVVRDDHVSLADIFPTLAEMVGAPIPYGVQGRSLQPMLAGEAYPADEFRSVYAELGFGGLPYGEDERPELHFDYAGPSFDELNTVTQSGKLKMVRWGRWKLVYDSLGQGELYDLEADPYELTNLWDDTAHAAQRAALTEELLRWTIRTEDDLPTAKYLPKQAEHGWYRPG